MENNHPTSGFARTAQRFAFLGEALHGLGGFAPLVTYSTDSTGVMKRPAYITGPCYLVPYPRESHEKYAARAAIATFESHLRTACERFTAYMGRKAPTRANADNPLISRMMEDADDCGNHLDVFWQGFMLEALARGTMLLLIDMPQERSDATMAQSLSGDTRAIPFIAPILPETIASYRMGRRGRFDTIAIRARETINGQDIDTCRHFDAQGWKVTRGSDPNSPTVLRQGTHPFGQCPVLIYTENSAPFPTVGRFAQIADLSLRLYNARSEVDEILRGQTFSVLTLQIPDNANADAIRQSIATIGTQALLTHQGIAPSFIAPPDGPATVYMARIEELRRAIAVVGMDEPVEASSRSESGLSRKMRFEAMNAALTRFSRCMQDLEARMWQLFSTALGCSVVEPHWPDDYNLSDPQADLDTLLTLQQTGFPDEVQRASRVEIVNALFNRAAPEELQALVDAVNNQVQEVQVPVPMNIVNAERVTPPPPENTP